jgi:NADPH-dependent ferric siderophore reductase
VPALFDAIAGTAAKILLRSGTIVEIRDLGTSFRRIDVRVEGANPKWAPGGKIQFHITGTTLRTFTPFAWRDGSVSFLVYRGGHGPATAWADALDVGTAIQMFGPRRSLNLDFDGGPILVGDETSLALAAAWKAVGAAPALAHVLEVTSAGESAPALEHLALDPLVVVERTGGDGHHPELGQHVVDTVRRHPAAPLVLTGKAQTIRAVRGALKDVGLSPNVRVKAYWDPNRAGLD